MSGYALCLNIGNDGGKDLGFVSHPNSQYVHCFPRMPLACGTEHRPPGVWNLTMSSLCVDIDQHVK